MTDLALGIWRRMHQHLMFAVSDPGAQLTLNDASVAPLFEPPVGVAHLDRGSNLSFETTDKLQKQHAGRGGAKHGVMGALDRLCRNKEGWGPVAQQRDLDFTPCFQDAALTIAPALLLALCAGNVLVKLAKQEPRALTKASKTILNVKNILLGIAALCAALSVSLQYGTLKHPLKNISFWASIALFVSYALALPVQHFNHTRERRSSTVLLFFWLFHLVANMVRLRTMASYPSPPISENLLEFALLAARTSLVVVVFALECAGVEVGQEKPSTKPSGNGALPTSAIASARPRPQTSESGFSVMSDSSYDPVDAEKECPENVANIFSRLSFHWMQPLMSVSLVQPLCCFPS